MNQNADQNPLAQPAISLTQGQAAVNNWCNFFLEAGLRFPEGDGILRGFQIQIADLQAILDYPQATGVRAYLGMTTPGDLTTLDLMLVPIANGSTTSPGQDILEPIVPGGGPDDPYSIFDFTQPCPIQCDLDSEMYFPNTQP